MIGADGQTASAVLAANASSTQLPVDAIDEASVLLPGDPAGPLDDRAGAAAIEALPVETAALDALPDEARGEGPTVDEIHALDFHCAATTARTYRHRLDKYAAWCASNGLRSFPAHPDTLRVFFGVLAHDRRWTTIHVSRAAIGAAHVALGYAPPESASLEATIQALRSGVACIPPIPRTTLLAVLERCSGDVLATRDRAILLLVHFGRLSPRRISALNREHIVRRESSYLVKASSAWASTAVPAPVELWCQPNGALCPVRALDAWLADRSACAGTPEVTATRGALFVTLHGGRGFPLVGGPRLGARGVSRVLKKRAAGAGLDPSEVCALGFRAHSSASRQA